MKEPSFQSIPVIDVSALFGSDESSARKVAAEIRAASIETGFFYVKNTNITRDLMDATYLAAKYFFALPEEAKQAIRVNSGSAHRGYLPFAQTLQPGKKIADLKESFNYAFPFTLGHPAMGRGHKLVGLNQWPEGEAVWREVLERYYAAIFELGQRILGGFALSLDMPRDFFRGLYKHPLVRTRLIHYPSQDSTPQSNEDQYGAAEHTDYGTITILWQDRVGGLQVKNRAGEWINASHIEDSFVINIGDMLELWSNNLFVSTPHRVINTSGCERYSIPVFFDPDFEVKVECLPNCSSAANPPKHSPLVAGEYIESRYDGTYAYRQPEKSW